MIWDILTQQEKNEVLLKILVHFSKVDDSLNDYEFSYLFHVCKSLDLDLELIREYSNESTAVNEILPHSEQDRMNLLYHLLFIMNADSQVSDEEEKAIYHLAFKLGFHEEITRDFIQLMKNYPIADLPEESMINIIRKYRN